MIEVKDLHKSFSRVKALAGVSFCARDGQVTGLVGPNGAGKSTALRILYTVLSPDHGTAVVDGYDTVTATREVQCRIGVLPDARGLYPRLTAREHLRYFGRLHGINGARLEWRIDEMVDIVGMADFVDRPARGYSRGEALKLALARALVHKPHNVLLDEPTNGLDVASSRAVRSHIRRIRESGRCVLFTSHIMQEVANLCDRIVVLARGRVAADGTPEELRQATGKRDLEEVFMTAVNTAAE